jgi:hypothetical protein
MPDEEIPATRPAVRRVDEAAADTATLVDMGVVPEQPEPPTPPQDPS